MGHKFNIKMSSEEDVVHLDFGNIELPITGGRLNSKESVSVATYMGMILISIFLFLAWLSTKLNLHNPRISERKIMRRLKNFGIGILSIVKIPYGRIRTGFPRLRYRVFGKGIGLRDTLTVFIRKQIAIGLIWFAILRCNFWYGYGQFIRNIIIIICLLEFMQTITLAVVQMLVLALNVVFNRLVMIVRGVVLFFTSVPCCVPWFVKRPVLVQDNTATSELCCNSPIQRACNCNLNFPKRPISVENNGASSDFVYE